jgi:hypothetical protein
MQTEDGSEDAVRTRGSVNPGTLVRGLVDGREREDG